MKKIIAASLLSVLLPTTAALAEEPAATPAPTSHGYGGIGLMLSSDSYTSPAFDTSSKGGGLIFNGAGRFDTNGDIGIGVNGELAFGTATDDNNSSVTSTESLFAVDGGILLAKVFYLSLGMQIQNQTDDNSGVTGTYFVVPLGLGMLWTDDTGYGLVQLRFGGGQFSTDSSSATEDVGMFGLRLVGQSGTAHGLQFMGGMEFDNYTFSNVDVTDFRFRAFIGLGFGS